MADRQMPPERTPEEIAELETRVERLEQEHSRQLEARAERDRRKTELLMPWTRSGS